MVDVTRWGKGKGEGVRRSAECGRGFTTVEKGSLGPKSKLGKVCIISFLPFSFRAEGGILLPSFSIAKLNMDHS